MSTGWQSLTIGFDSCGADINGMLLIPNSEEPLPGAILCHGMASDHRTMKPSAERLARMGVACLTFDFRGHGKSGGICDDNIVNDVIAARDYLSKRLEVDPQRIALVGHSMGAVASVLAASRLDELKALVPISCASGATITQEMSQEISQRLAELGDTILEFPKLGHMLWQGPIHGVLSWAQMRLRGYRLRIDVGKSMDALARGGVIAAIEGTRPFPVLFVHCKGDRIVPYQDTLELYERAKQPKELLIARGGFHSYPLFPGGVRRRWMSWLSSVLTAGGKQ